MLLGELLLILAKPQEVGWTLFIAGDSEAWREKGIVPYRRCCFQGPFISCVGGILSHFLCYGVFFPPNSHPRIYLLI